MALPRLTSLSQTVVSCEVAVTVTVIATGAQPETVKATHDPNHDLREYYLHGPALVVVKEQRSILQCNTALHLMNLYIGNQGWGGMNSMGASMPTKS